jgi:hypothetical protein
VFGSLGKKVEAVFHILGGMGADIADIKQTVRDIMKDLADGKAALAEIKAITGHTATAVTVATTASAPAPASAVLSAGTPPAAPGLVGQLGNVVGDVAKGIQSVIPGQH